MQKLSKDSIDVFGEKSVASIHYLNQNYICSRDNDGIILAIGKELKGYMGDIIRTMYTGGKYATGDYILVSDRHGLICKFKD